MLANIFKQKSLLAVLFSLSFVYCFGKKNFVLISAPGSGKGTFSQYLVEKYNYIQICPGDIFRNEIALQTPLGKEIEPIVLRGDYVDEKIVCSLIETYLLKAITSNQAFIIDGFPRSEYSFNFLHTLLNSHHLAEKIHFIEFLASDTTCTHRILGRLLCTSCCKIFHATDRPPLKNNICDYCNNTLSKRMADTKEIAIKRLQYFHTYIQPLSTKAESSYIVHKINTEKPLLYLQSHYDEMVH